MTIIMITGCLNNHGYTRWLIPMMLNDGEYSMINDVQGNLMMLNDGVMMLNDGVMMLLMMLKAGAYSMGTDRFS